MAETKNVPKKGLERQMHQINYIIAIRQILVGIKVYCVLILRVMLAG